MAQPPGGASSFTNDGPFVPDQVPAGIELDRLIHERVFSGRIAHTWSPGGEAPRTCAWCRAAWQERWDLMECRTVPPFSTSILAATLLIAHAGFVTLNEQTPGQWNATHRTGSSSASASAETAALAICRAVLKAMDRSRA